MHTTRSLGKRDGDMEDGTGDPPAPCSSNPPAGGIRGPPPLAARAHDVAGDRHVTAGKYPLLPKWRIKSRL